MLAGVDSNKACNVYVTPMYELPNVLFWHLLSSMRTVPQ